MRQLLLDARFALRLLRRAPGFYATLLAVLVGGIGATTAMFSLVESLLLVPLPYPDAGQLTVIWRKTPEVDHLSSSVPDFVDYKAQATTFEHMSATSHANMSLAAPGQRPQALRGAQVSGDFFAMFGVTPLHGRLLGPDDDRVDAPRVVVIGAAAWRDRLGADPAIVGRAVRLGGEPFTVVGVAREGFVFSGTTGTGVDFWIPLAATTRDYARAGRGNHYLELIGRRKPGVTLAEAETQLVAIAKSLEAAYPDTNTRKSVRLVDLQDELVATSKNGLWVLFAAISMVFLIVCANVANLLLTRAQTRRAEMAARAALGATPARLAAQLVTETVVVFLAGAAGGALLARWLVGIFATDLVSGGARTMALGVDGWALAFCVAVSLVSGLVFGLVPALAAARVEPQAVLNASAARAGVGKHQRWTRNALVVAQVALACALLAGSGLALRAFAEVAATPPGFDAANLATVRLWLPETKYAQDASVVRFVDQLVAKLAAQPGVTAVAANSTMPMCGSTSRSSFEIEGRPAWAPGDSPSLGRNAVTPGYFAAMGIPVLRGRDFTPADRDGARRVIVISQATAERFFAGEDPVGRRIDFTQGEQRDWREIVGVAGDVRRAGLDRPIAIESYTPIAQEAERWLVVAVRSPRAAEMLRELPRIVETIDPEQAASNARLMRDRITDTIGNQRYVVQVLGAFAVAALLLATLGLFGLVSYSTAQRTRELGVRMALGSTPAGAVRLVLGDGLRLLGVGLAVGLALALLVGRVLASRVTGVAAFDPAVFATIPSVLALSAAAASVVPAWRVARIPPAIALRYE